MQENLPKVVIIDDYPLFRKAVCDVLSASGEFQVIGQTSDGRTAQTLGLLNPQLAILAMDAESYNAMQLLVDLKGINPEIKVVMIVNDPDDSEKLLRPLRYEVNGYLLRTIDSAELIEQLKRTLAGGFAVGDKITSVLARMLGDKGVAQNEQRSTSNLTTREKQVLSCIAMGMSNKEISETLFIRDGTVKVHVKHLLKKLRFRSRVEVAVWASENGYKHKSMKIR